MKYLFELDNERKLLLTAAQLEGLIDIIDGADMLVNKHVGERKGTHGYSNCYIHDIQSKRSHEWLSIKPVTDDYIETIRLAAKLEDNK